MNPTLWHLCQRDALLSLRDQARQEYASGNPHAGHVMAWVDRVLAQPIFALLSIDAQPPVNLASTDTPPLRCRLHSQAPTRMQ